MSKQLTAQVQLLLRSRDSGLGSRAFTGEWLGQAAREVKDEDEAGAEVETEGIRTRASINGQVEKVDSATPLCTLLLLLQPLILQVPSPALASD